jgi:hypothetical protein
MIEWAYPMFPVTSLGGSNAIVRLVIAFSECEKATLPLNNIWQNFVNQTIDFCPADLDGPFGFMLYPPLDFILNTVLSSRYLSNPPPNERNHGASTRTTSTAHRIG